MKKAFAYLRVSGKGQVEGDGFQRQLLAIKRYAAANGIKITQVFREEGVSGTKEMVNRPAFSEMMTALYSNGTKLVLVEKLDRLARDLMIQESIIADLRKHGYGLVSVMEPDLLEDDPSRKLMRQMMGAFAEYEKSMIVLKLRGARQRMRAKTGRCEGAKPYGMKAGESETEHRIKTLRAGGSSLQTIADQLNADGIPSRRGGQWHPTQVGRIAERTTA
jgi:DNA invertase Pin-like site-specific DNA recombinase